MGKWCVIVLKQGTEIKLRTVNRRQSLPGWSEYCKLAHESALEAFLLWRTLGSPRYGPAFIHMNRTRAYFKRCMRKCKQNVERSKADALAQKLS